MRIGIITNITSPYKSLQISEFAKIKDSIITVYYTEPTNKKIKWEEIKANGFKEIQLKQYKLFKYLGIIINKKVLNIINDNDVILLCGYNQLTNILVSVLCKILKKPYIILFDGISINRIDEQENKLKFIIKRSIIMGAKAIMANGQVSKQYLEKKFNYPSSRIYNQFLSVDYRTIKKLHNYKEIHIEYLREKYNISKDKKVLIYSGRLIEKKNVESIIRAISILNKRKSIVLLITGGGELATKLKLLADELKVNVIITGFITKQEELFKNYFIGDALILPSLDEPWGLVVNEALTCGLPVIVSNICGCSRDLVKENENGYLIDPTNIEDISLKIDKILFNDDKEKMSYKSLEIISEWTFENSKITLEKLLN